MPRVPIKDYLRESHMFNVRLSGVVVIISFLVLVLIGRLAYLQIVDHRHYMTLSNENSINPVPIAPVRGLIFDRNGVVLAENYPVLTLEIVPDQVKNMKALLSQLGKIVTLNQRDLRNFYRQLRDKPHFDSLVLRSNLTEEEADRFAVQRYRLTGADLHARLERYYPQGGLAVAALGYVGRISESEAKTIDDADYRGISYIGKIGVEASYENLLRGQSGIKKIEVNAEGRAIRTLDRIPPAAGDNIYLNLDARAQAAAEQALGNHRGAVVAIDPKNGGILAFVSTPTYNPNPFVDGISTKAYRALTDDPDAPLLNRALDGRYSPGSTIKPFLALGALDDGLNPDKTYFCPGYYHLPGSTHIFHCWAWREGGHGKVDLHEAIVESCDVYFYNLAVHLGISRIDSILDAFGFNSKTGIDIPGELAGLVPSPAWKAAHGLPWYPGETVIMGVGQGAMLVTPLELANATAMIADHGVGFKPRLVRAIQNPTTQAMTYLKPVPGRTFPLQNMDYLKDIVHDMADVVSSPKGTGYFMGRNAPYQIAGKSGTAQVKDMPSNGAYNPKEIAKNLRDNAVFIAFAPVPDPRIAVAVIVEHGGFGGEVAGPIARKVMDAYLLPDHSSPDGTAKLPKKVQYHGR
ncbi:MAG: penicillin-binding protein 2 [Gammaproteobacteria bacterium]|nr:penicillin-binding protein 2 [Gammaproteobacteria bacterium]